MARIPTYQDQGSLSIGSDRAKQSPSLAGQTGENIKSVGRIIGQAGQDAQSVANNREKIQAERKRLQDDAETLKAQIALTDKFNDIHLEAGKDPDIWGASKTAQAKMRKAIDESAKEITYEDTKGRFKLNAEMDFTNKSFAIEKDVYSRQSEERKTVILARNDQLKKEYLNEVNPKMKAAILGHIENNMEAGVVHGAISREAARLYIEANRKDLALGQVVHAVSLASRSTDYSDRFKKITAELNKGEEGVYKNLTVAERDEMIALANVEFKKAEKNQETFYLANQAEMLKNMPELTPEKILEQLHAGKVSFDFASKMINAKTGAAETVTAMGLSEDATFKRYQDVVNLAVAAKNPEEVKKIQLKIVDEYGKGLIAEENIGELAALLEVANDKKPAVSTGFKILKSIAKSYIPVAAFRMFEALSRSILNGLPPEQAPVEAKKIMEKTVIENNPDRTKYTIGQVIPLPNGKSFKVTGYGDDGEPDGDVIE